MLLLLFLRGHCCVLNFSSGSKNSEGYFWGDVGKLRKPRQRVCVCVRKLDAHVCEARNG